MPAKKHKNAVQGKTIPKQKAKSAKRPKNAWPKGVHPLDDWDNTGMPVTLIGPECPDGQQCVVIIGPKGAVHWFNTTTRQMYTRDGKNPDGTLRYKCSTLTFNKEEKEEKPEEALADSQDAPADSQEETSEAPAKGKKGSTQPSKKEEEKRDRYLCKGRMVPHEKHNKHSDGVPVKLIRKRIFDMYMRALVAHYGGRMDIQRLRQFQKLFYRVCHRKTIPAKKIYKTWPKKFNRVIKNRSPFPDEWKRWPNKRDPIMDDPIETLPELAEATFRYVDIRCSGAIDFIRPAFKTPYKGLRNSGIPDRAVPYKLVQKVPGNYFHVFILSKGSLTV